eukprot:TRINITY_DN62046_c0_g1_i1.p1 TRINITY_DN62046_c0_g1~~TRINITY_DN62046_c0_g1_i1.p1  ORF type:complete len:460 (-),score=62.06 TRINITY_DN62046_c0_g1_i1:37-1224(-)
MAAAGRASLTMLPSMSDTFGVNVAGGGGGPHGAAAGLAPAPPGGIGVSTGTPLGGTSLGPVSGPAWGAAATVGIASNAASSGDATLDDHQHVVARVRIASHPGHYMNHEASHLVDAKSVEYWASLPGHVRDQAFVFELDEGQHVISRVEWKDRGDGMGVARMCLEALVGDGWQKLSTWDTERTANWQAHSMNMSLRSHQWRLTFVATHGDENHLVVQAVRFIAKLPQTSPAHNASHAHRIALKLWQDRVFTDVDVVCDDGRGKRISVHRAILAAASPVFAAMLSSEMKEGQAHEIVISDADERAVEETLEYIYTGSVGGSACCGMVVLGHKYDIPGLVEYAAPVALGNLTAENVVSELRTLRSFAHDKQLGPVFEALQGKVRENDELFKAVLLGI